MALIVCHCCQSLPRTGLLLCGSCHSTYDGHVWYVDPVDLTVRLWDRPEGARPVPDYIAGSQGKKLALQWDTDTSPIPRIFEVRALWAAQDRAKRTKAAPSAGSAGSGCSGADSASAVSDSVTVTPGP